jgi:hypothetical protein
VEGEVDARPLSRIASVATGIMGGAGAYCYQWALRNPGTDTPGVLVAMIAILGAYLGFTAAGMTALFTIVINVRSRRRLWTAPLYVVAAFLIVLYAFGGRWPFWHR